MLESEVLFLLLHLCVRPFDHRSVAHLILNRLHNAHRHSVNIAQIDWRGVDISSGPLLQADRLLELASYADLIEVHVTIDR